MNTDKIYAEQLANEYAPKDTSKIIALRKLDAKAKLPANVFTYTLGVISSLVFSAGMCLAMGQIGSGTPVSFVFGIIIGIVGIMAIIREWLKNDCRDTVEQIISVIQTCVKQH